MEERPLRRRLTSARSTKPYAVSRARCLSAHEDQGHAKTKTERGVNASLIRRLRLKIDLAAAARPKSTTMKVKLMKRRGC